MIPQDTRAPQRQQRWVEADNYSGETIPAYAVVEAVDAFRPEQSHELTPLGGRTVLRVRKPSTGLKYPIMVNGLIDMAATGSETSGKVTNDYPTYVLYDDANTPVAGDEWGPKAGSWKIHKGGKGFYILGDADPTTGIVRVLHCCSGGTLIFFKMTTKLPLGGKGTAIEIKSGPLYEEIGDPFPIKDPHMVPGTWREDVHAFRRSTVGGYRGWCVIPQYPELDANGEPYREIVHMEQLARSITFTLKTDLSGGVAEVTVNNWYLGKDPHDVWPAAAGEKIFVYDPQALFPMALVGAKGMARYNDRDHRYEAVACDQMCLIMSCDLAADMCLENSSGTISNPLPATWPPYGQMPDPLPDSVFNTLPMEGSAGQGAFIIFNYSNARWEFLNVGLTRKYAGYELEYASCQLKLKRAPVGVHYCNKDDDYHTLQLYSHTYLKSIGYSSCYIYGDTGNFCSFAPQDTSPVTQVSLYSHDLVTDVTKTTTQDTGGNLTSCKVVQTKKPFCLFDQAPTPATSDVFAATQMSGVVTNVYETTDCIVQTKQEIWVVCAAESDVDSDVFCTTDCP